MSELTSTATCRITSGADQVTGERITASTVAERVRWAIDLATGHADRVVALGYTPEGLAALTKGVGPDGRKLPSNGYVAARRLGWAPQTTDGLYLPDRLRRCGEEAAMRKLRQAAWVEQVVAALVATWPTNPKKRTSDEWDALWAATPSGLDKATARNRTRQIAGHLAGYDALPSDLCELEPDPKVGRALLLAAADRQLVRLERTGHAQAALHVKLPTCPTPGSRKDWTWVALLIAIPDNVPSDARLHTPTLRIVDGRVRADVPWTQAIPKSRKDGHVRAVGFDWGVNTLVTATIADLTDDGHAIVDGKPAHFAAAGMHASNARLRKLRERLRGRRDRTQHLVDGLDPNDPRHPKLTAKVATLDVEIGRISRRQRNANRQLAWAAARWLVDLATANGATVIYAEDLRSMEARGLGRRVNTRASNAVRGQVLAAVRHLAARAGIAVIEVPARDTSKLCPRCHTRLHHTKAPDRPTERGHKWALCRACGFSGDRDHAAAERIASRGLVSQGHVRAHRTTGALRATKHDDVKVRRSRRQHGKKEATPRQASSTRPVPATPTPHGAGAPASGGTASNGPASAGSEMPNTVLTSRQARRARVRRRMHGRGFHRHVHASPTSTRPDWRARDSYPADRGSLLAPKQT